MNWNVKASPHFWRTALPLKEKYTHEQFASIIRSIREAICELAAKGAWRRADGATTCSSAARSGTETTSSSTPSTTTCSWSTSDARRNAPSAWSASTTMTPYPTTSDQKTTGKQTGGAIHKPEAPPSHSRQEQVTSIKDGRTPNPCSPEPRQRGDGCQPKPWTWKHTAISIRTVRRRHRRARHPRTGMETASIQPSRDDDVARVPASIFVFPSRSVP